MSNLQSRPYHAFLSYSHRDRELAIAVHRWLTANAGFQVWFDENHLEVGSPVAARLAEQMSLCRSWVLLCSKDALASPWVTAERDQALHCHAESSRFELLTLRIDDCNVGSALGRFSWLDAPHGAITVTTARQIIDRLDSRAWSGRQEDLRDVFVSRGWRPPDLPFGDALCRNLSARKFRLRLVGDAPDRDTFDAGRVNDIMSGCYAHLVVLPVRGTGSVSSEHDYRHFVRELDLSRRLGIPQFLIAETATALPPSLSATTIRLNAADVASSDAWADDLPDWLEQLFEELKPPPAPAHYFLAAEYRGDMPRVNLLREFIEAATGIPCAMGKDFEGQALRERIARSVSSSALVIANLASSDWSPASALSINLNTCVEAGIAIGASNVRVARGEPAIPVFLLAHAPSGEAGRTERLPFMFRDSQIVWYSTEAEMIAHCRRLLHPYRRRIIN